MNNGDETSIVMKAREGEDDGGEGKRGKLIRKGAFCVERSVPAAR